MNSTVTTEERAKTEAQFHDAIATETNVSAIDVDQFFQSVTALENRRALAFFGGDLKGKHILDLGCGYGEASTFFAKRGATVEALDVSEGMIVLARQLAEKNGVSPNFQIAAAEHLPFASESFDFVYGNGVLHHVTLEEAIPEIWRVLKPGGRAAFVEPLPYNPVINVYRNMATKFRSEHEHPITRQQRKVVMNSFRTGRHEEFWITGLAVFLWMFLAERVHPNDTPYWKKVIYDADRYRWLLRPLMGVDRLLTHLPLVRWLAWNTLLLVEK